MCAAMRYEGGLCSVNSPENRAKHLKKWNSSGKAYASKLRWKEKDPKKAWAVSATGGAKARARAAGLAFDLDKEYVRALAPDVCPVFGTKFVFTGKARSGDSPSIDRIRPELGYVRGNVAVISMKANAIKSNATAAEIRRVAEWLSSIE